MTPTHSLGWLFNSNNIYIIYLYYIYIIWLIKTGGALVGSVCFLLNNTFNLLHVWGGESEGYFAK